MSVVLLPLRPGRPARPVVVVETVAPWLELKLGRAQIALSPDGRLAEVQIGNRSIEMPAAVLQELRQLLADPRVAALLDG